MKMVSTNRPYLSFYLRFNNKVACIELKNKTLFIQKLFHGQSGITFQTFLHNDSKLTQSKAENKIFLILGTGWLFTDRCCLKCPGPGPDYFEPSLATTKQDRLVRGFAIIFREI